MDGLPRVLTPLTALLDRIAAVPPLARTETVPLDRATGRVLVEALRTTAPVPPRPLARRSGIAVRAEETLGAGPYGPVPLSLAEPVPAGAALPAGADAVLAREAIAWGPTQAALSSANLFRARMMAEAWDDGGEVCAHDETRRAA